MLLVTVQLYPSGNVLRGREIGRMIVGNVSDLAAVSDYIVYCREGANPVTERKPVQTEFEIKEHKRAQSVWALVAKAASETALKIETGETIAWS